MGFCDSIYTFAIIYYSLDGQMDQSDSFISPSIFLDLFLFAMFTINDAFTHYMESLFGKNNMMVCVSLAQNIAYQSEGDKENRGVSS